MAKTKQQCENHFGGLLLHIYHQKKKKGHRPDDNKGRGLGKMPWRATSGTRAIGY